MPTYLSCEIAYRTINNHIGPQILYIMAGIYIIVLEIMAVKAVNQFGWGPAIGSYFIPGLALLLICCCVAAIVGSVMGLALGNVFSTLNQSLLH